MIDEIRTLTVPVGSLAARLHRAESELIAAERQLESMLTSLYGSFSDWEAGPDGLDVYDTEDSPAAASALFRAGFRSVRCHDHDKTKFARCGCAIRRDLIGGLS